MAQRHCGGMHSRGSGFRRKKPSSLRADRSVHRRRRLPQKLHKAFGILRGTTSVAVWDTAAFETYNTSIPDANTPPCNVGCTANTTESETRFVPAGCSQVRAPCSLLPSCIVRRLSESRWCKGSCPVHCICRLIVPILARFHNLSISLGQVGRQCHFSAGFPRKF